MLPELYSVVVIISPQHHPSTSSILNNSIAK
jgi:hypothetical protein